MNYKPGQMVRFVISRRPHSQKYVGTPCLVVQVGDVKGLDFCPIEGLTIAPGDLVIRHADGHTGVVMNWQVEPIVDDGDLVVEADKELICEPA